MKLRLSTIVVLLYTGSIVLGQETESKKEKSVEHQLGLMVGYAWVPNAIEAEGNANSFAIPALGFDYSYCFKERLALRLVNDIELSRYFVKEAGGAFLEREFKYIGALCFVYEPVEHIGLFIGPGMELESHESFTVLKIGAELIKEFEDGWSVGFNTSIDINELYETFSAGMFLAKRL